MDRPISDRLADEGFKRMLRRHLNMVPEINYTRCKLFRDIHTALTEPDVQWLKYARDLFGFFSVSNCKTSDIDEGILIMETLAYATTMLTAHEEAKKNPPKQEPAYNDHVVPIRKSFKPKIAKVDPKLPEAT